VTVSPEKIAEMLAAAENPGVTPGPWNYLDIGEVWHAVEADDNHTPIAVTDHGDPTGEHIALCDPQTITAILNELVAARSQLDALTAARDEAVEAALIAGWNACRKDIYALAEDIINKADHPATVLRGFVTPSQEAHSKGFHAGEKHAAKSFARAFSSFEAKDADRLNEARDELRARSALGDHHG
jgi:hypothetical protein